MALAICARTQSNVEARAVGRLGCRSCATEHNRSALPDGAERGRHEAPDGRKDNCGVEFGGRPFAGPARPHASEGIRQTLVLADPQAA